MSQDFSKGKIYKITNDYNDDIYVGSTCDTLVRRFTCHKSNSKNINKQSTPLYKLINEIGFDRFRIQLICDYPCEDKYQLRQKEGEYIRELGTLNQQIAGRNMKIYYVENKEKLTEQKKDYYENHKEMVLKYVKEYRIKNKDQIKENRQKYRQENKEKISKNKKEKILCDCGCFIRKDGITEHKLTKKHIKLMEQNTN